MKKNKSKYNVESIDMLIFPRKIYITDCEPDEFVDLFEHKEGELVKPNKEKSFASVYDDASPKNEDEVGIVMWVNNEVKLYPDEIAHEICHIVDDVYQYVGLHTVELGGEQHAYFFQYVYRLVYDKLEKLGRIHGK